MHSGYYVAIILYRSSSDSPEYTPMYEESTVLLKASDEMDARQKNPCFCQNPCCPI